MELSRSTRRTRQILLTPLIDVVYLLLLYFMITTSFTKTESMELSIPSAKSAQSRAAKDSSIIRLYIGDNGDVFLGRNKMDVGALNDLLGEIFAKTPDRKILVLAAGTVVVQDLVGVMDMIYIAGARNISVADWKTDDALMTPPMAAPAASPATGGSHGV